MKITRKMLIATTLCTTMPLFAQQQQQSSQQSQAQQQPPSEKSQQELKVSDQELKQQVTDANKASKLIGMHVKNKENEEVGKVKDLAIDFQSGKVAYAVVSVGSTLGFGGKMVAIPLQALTLKPGDKAVVVDLPKQQISQAQGFNEQSWPDLDAAQKGQTIGLAASQQQSQGGAGSQSEQSAGGQSSESITNLQQLSSASDPSSLQGKHVDLKQAKVKQVLGKDAVTVTSEGAEQEVLVKSQRPVESLKADQTVTVSGSVRPVPQDISQLGIDQSAAQKIQGQKFYIQAQQIKPSDQ